MNLAFTKTVGNALFPADQSTAEAVSKAKLGTVWRGDFKKARNPLFHRKYFALLNLAFDYWNPDLPEIHGIRAEKSFEQFRKDVTILAGYYSVETRLDGTARVNAKSISFAQMDEAEFENLYSATIDVILRKVMTNMDDAQIRQLVDEIVMGFA